jgi:hypothetical protein
MKTVIITRKHWGQHTLRSPQTGKQCCLGFVCKSFGLSNKDIAGNAVPYGLAVAFQNTLPGWLLHSPDVNKAMAINDDLSFSMEKKEELLKPLFAKHGIKLVFRGPLS